MIICRWVALVVLVVAGVVVSPATDASAAAVTVCTADQPVTTAVAGDLLVPDGQGCELRDVVVQGRATVGANAVLRLAEDAHIDGDAAIGLHSDIELEGASSVGGDIALDYANVMTVSGGSSVGGSIHGAFTQTDAMSECDFLVFDSTVHGNVEVSVSGAYRDVCLNNAHIGGNLKMANGAFSFSSSAIGGDVVLTAARSFREVKYEKNGYAPDFLCSLTVGGDLTWQGSFSHVVLGGGGCIPGRLDISGSVFITDNLGSVSVSAHVHGDVVCSGNSHDPVAGHPTSRHLQNIVDGQLSGQCTTLAVRPS